jgi:hypothetical protein
MSAGWRPDAPSPDQLKEFYAQIASGRITAVRLQRLLAEKVYQFTVDGTEPSMDELLSNGLQSPHYLGYTCPSAFRKEWGKVRVTAILHEPKRQTTLQRQREECEDLGLPELDLAMSVQFFKSFRHQLRKGLVICQCQGVGSHAGNDYQCIVQKNEGLMVIQSTSLGVDFPQGARFVRLLALSL